MDGSGIPPENSRNEHRPPQQETDVSYRLFPQNQTTPSRTLSPYVRKTITIGQNTVDTLATAATINM